ncbi:hypothetical protein [Saltatorellus ferox]
MTSRVRALLRTAEARGDADPAVLQTLRERVATIERDSEVRA